jgi:uncharacterized protein YegL
MKKDYCDINLVLDRSGSMKSIRDDTIGGVNVFLDQQKLLPGEATFSLFQFDNIYEVVVDNKLIKDVQPLTRETFVPRGCTALLDAIGKTINNVGNKLSALADDQRPEKVLVAIVTDGEENSSVEFTRSKVFDMINHQKDVYKWEFIYLGANQDAIAAGSSFGINAGSCLNYEATSAGVTKSFASFTSYGSGLRCNGVGSF